MKSYKQHGEAVSNKKLIKKIRGGSKPAFEQLFNLHYSNLQRFLWGYVKSSHVAEELVQDVFLKVWENRSTLNPDKNIKTYIYKIGRNLAIDYIRHKKIEQEWEKEKKTLYSISLLRQDLGEKKSHKTILKEVKKAIEKLPERRRQVFILSRFDGMTYKEIANVLEISVNTVETHIYRSLKTLRRKFSSYLSKS